MSIYQILLAQTFGFLVTHRRYHLEQPLRPLRPYTTRYGVTGSISSWWGGVSNMPPRPLRPASPAEISQ